MDQCGQVGMAGLQTIADMLKLIQKEDIVAKDNDKLTFQSCTNNCIYRIVMPHLLQFRSPVFLLELIVDLGIFISLQLQE